MMREKNTRKHVVMRKVLAIGIAVAMAVCGAIPMSFGWKAYAADGDAYLALGANLSDEERSTVLNLLDVDNIDDYNVIYVTNDEEHKYLDSYVSSDQIGSKALSSVRIEETADDDIEVSTINIGYCTEGMYENALETAGVEGAKVTVAGPFEISGTAALVGIIKAYEEMTGEDVSDEVIEGAVNEITTTGEIGEEIGDKETAEDIISEVKEELAENPDMSAEDIKDVIQDVAEEHGAELSEETLNKAEKMIENIQGLDIDWDGLLEKAEDVMDSGLIDKIIQWFKDLFS